MYFVCCVYIQTISYKRYNGKISTCAVLDGGSLRATDGKAPRPLGVRRPGS